MVDKEVLETALRLYNENHEQLLVEADTALNKGRNGAPYNKAAKVRLRNALLQQYKNAQIIRKLLLAAK